jgi:Endoplasmic reticulum vesicle transporter
MSILKDEVFVFVLTIFVVVFLKSSAAKVRLNEEDMSDEENQWAEEVKRHRQRLHNSWADEDHPGCQLSGHLLLDRVPGNFHIQARSPHHDLVPHLTNVSHVIHSLSIGEPIVKTLVNRGLSTGKLMVPKDLTTKMSPMDGNAYITQDLHEAYHHYLKVVTTNVKGLQMGNRELKAYQIIQNSQLSIYRPDIVPEAKVCYIVLS